MAGVRRTVAVASVVLSVVVTGAIAANPTPWRTDPTPSPASAVATRGPEPALSARARSVLERARAVQQRLDDLETSPATQVTPSPPPAAAAQPAPPPVAITSAPAVTSSASS